jgi:hypothetical protein
LSHVVVEENNQESFKKNEENAAVSPIRVCIGYRDRL